MEKVMLVAAVIGLPTGVGTCTHQAKQNELLTIEIRERTDAYARALVAKSDSLATVRALLRRCRHRLRAAHLEVGGEPAEGPRRAGGGLGAALGRGVRSVGRMFGNLLGIGG